MIILFAWALNYPEISQLKQLPSPIYGGDYYNHLGMMEHIAQGGSLFKSGQLIGPEPWTPILYHVLVVLFSRLFSLDLIHGVLYFSFVVMALSAIVVYAFANLLFKDKTISLIPVFLVLARYPVFKYLDFTIAVILPFFFYSMVRAHTQPDLKWRIIAGISYGLVGITHTVGFISASFFLAIFYLYFEGYKKIKGRNDQDKPFLSKDAILHYGLIFTVGFLIALLYWYPLIFVYHGKTLNAQQTYDMIDFSSLSIGGGFIIDVITGTFLNFSSLFSAANSILLLASLVFLFAGKFPNKDYFIAMGLAAFFGLTHFLLTNAVINTSFMPPYQVNFLFNSITSPFLFTLSVFVSIQLFKQYRQFILAAVFLLLISQNLAVARDFSNDQWTRTGKSELPSFMKDSAEWAKANTQLSDVFLTTNEDGFAFNALTGRKLVTIRRSHANSFEDMDRRMADAAVMLYGDNDTQRRNLLKKYDVKYLYWSYGWISSEYTIDKTGKIVGTYDPLVVFDTPEYRQYFKDNGVKYSPSHTWIDPGIRGENIPQFDILFTFPANWDASHPWDKGLDKYLVLEKEFTENGQLAAKIFKVVYP